MPKLWYGLTVYVGSISAKSDRVLLGIFQGILRYVQDCFLS